MVEQYVSLSELHFKKELTALQKAQFLRDPETFSSWRSPLSSRSSAAYNFWHENGARDISTGENMSGRLSKMALTNEKARKRVSLSNLGSHSSKSTENGIKLDAYRNQLSVEGILQGNLGSSQNRAAERYFVPAASNCTVKGLPAPLRSTATRLRKAGTLGNCLVEHAGIPKDLELPSAQSVLSSIEKFDNTEYCNEHAHVSPCASPLFSVSGCTNWPCSSKIFRGSRREGSSNSCTPTSTGSYYMHVGRQKTSATGSWDETSSFEGDEFDHLDLPVRQGCRLPCYWSKRTKDRCFKGVNSPSLSDSVGKKGGSICCRSHTMYRRNRRKKSTGFDKTCYLPECSQDSALLVNKSHVTPSDEISTNFGELDFEALSRLDGRRWSRSKSQEVFELGDDREAAFNIAYKKCLSLKYKPRTFDEIIGQNIVVQSLVNDIMRGRIASGYIFYGPNGTGKTSTARIFAAALNCLSTEGNKPCCLCKECTLFCKESEVYMREVSAINKKCIDRVINLLKNMNTLKMSRYKIFIINECHLLTSKMWSAFMRVLEETNSHVVIIFITIDHENVPCAITSCCQKYLFSKIKDADVICRLEKISAAENLDVDMEALNLIAANSDGSLEDAETMLYQLSLLGKRITSSLVNDLVVAISDEKLLELVEIAMSSNNEEIVERSKSLVDSGVDPIALISQLAGLIMDIIAGTYQLSESQCDNQDLGGRSLTGDELRRLQEALKILSDAVKWLEHSSEHSPMLTGAQYLSLLTSALLQLSSDQNAESTQLNSNKVHAAEKTNGITKSCSAIYSRSDNLIELQESSSRAAPTSKKISTHISSQKSSTRLSSHNSNSNAVSVKSRFVNHTSSNNVHLDCSANGIPWDLFEIWSSCIQKCYSRTLRQMLSLHGKLISVTENEGILIAFIAFTDRCVKLRAERYLSSITNSLEKILKCNVEVRLGLIVDDKWIGLVPPPESLASQHVEKIWSLRNQKRIVPDGMKGLPTKTTCTLSHPQKIRDASEDTVHKKIEKNSTSAPQSDGHQVESSLCTSEGNLGYSETKGNQMEIEVIKLHSQASSDQLIENAWLYASEKAIPGLPIPLITDKRQGIHQKCVSNQPCDDSFLTFDKSFRNCEDEVNKKIKAIKLNDSLCHNKKQDGDNNYYAISPSLLHSNNLGGNFEKDNSEYESAHGCGSLFCWKTNKMARQQIKKGTNPVPQKSSHLLFGKRMKSKTGVSRMKG